ncbi:MAG: Hpt domain-containing protein, partial [Thiohalomonadales bacterium]
LLKELPAFKTQIIRSFEDKDLEALEEHSHKLHGATCYCNVPDLKSAVQILEQAARMREIKDMERKVGAVKHEIDLLVQSSQYG